MGFMVPVAERFAAYRVETDAGTETVPEDVCGTVNLTDCTEDTLEVFYDYLEGSVIHDVERVEGWFSRLSAPGYLDCTEWSGPFATAEEALAHVKDLYDVDDDGDDASEEEASE